jgi:hypothetical protein
VLAKLHPRVEPEVGSQAFEELVVDLPEAVKFERQLPTSSNLLGSVLDQLVVWSELRQSRMGGPLATSPMQIDQSKSGATLAQWMSLPWYGPEHVILPGYNSDGGTAMKSNLNGTDLFLTTIGLMASGTRTILISRWSMGGANSLALTRNFASRQPKMKGGKALRESIAAAQDLELNYDNEPRIRAKKTDPKLKAQHPAFWSGLIRLEIPDDSKSDPGLDPGKLNEDNLADPLMKPDANAAEKEKPVDADKPPAEKKKIENQEGEQGKDLLEKKVNPKKGGNG